MPIHFQIPSQQLLSSSEQLEGFTTRKMRFITPLLFTLSLQATARSTLNLPLEDRDVSCLCSPSIPYDSSCYGTLGISAWLQNSTNCCGPRGNPNEPWSTCFLRLSLANADYDCSQINVKSCSLEAFQLAQGINDIAQTRYVVRNLFCEFVSLPFWAFTYRRHRRFIDD